MKARGNRVNRIFFYVAIYVASGGCLLEGYAPS
jgi:hypothetical protein